MPSGSNQPGRYNPTITRGSVWAPKFRFTGVTIAGWTWQCVLTDQAGATHTPTVTYDSDNSVTVSLTSDEVDTVALGVGEWYLRRVDTGYEFKYLAGDFNCILNHP